KWMHEAENSVVNMLMTKYENQLVVNQELEKRIGSLQMITKQSDPVLNRKKIWWIRPEEAKNEMMSFVFRAAGAEWTEKSMDKAKPVFGTEGDASGTPDIILISNAELHAGLLEAAKSWQGTEQSAAPVIVDIGARFTDMSSPEGIVEF